MQNGLLNMLYSCIDICLALNLGIFLYHFRFDYITQYKQNLVNPIQYQCFSLFIIIGTTIEMQHKEIPINMVNAQKQQSDSEQSEWSLSSLEELKGLNLHEMKNEQENNHEIEPSKTEKQKQIEIQYPPKQVITPATNLFLVGKIIQQVGELLIVQASSPETIVDLNNCVFSEERRCWGFVIDVLGKVQEPFYAIKLFPEEVKTIDLHCLLGRNMYYAEGCKTLTEEDIISIEGKRAADFDMDSDSDDQPQQFSEQPFRKEYRMNKQRRNSFEERPNYQRQRTRQNKNRRPHQTYEGRFNRNNAPQMQMPPNNQQYLQNMYAMYYQQMMQMQGQNPPPNMQMQGSNSQSNMQMQGNSQQGMMPPFFHPMPPK